MAKQLDMSRPPNNRILDSQKQMTSMEWRKVRVLLLEMVAQVSPKYRSKFDASDIVQQTMFEASQNFDQFRGRTDGELAAWLRRILSRNLLDSVRRLRSQKRSVARETRLEASRSDARHAHSNRLAADQSTPSIQVARNEERDRMLEAVQRLPADQREAITLHHIKGWSTAEVAAQMKRSNAAIAGLIHRGLKSLRENLNK